MDSRLPGRSPRMVPPNHTTELICQSQPLAAARQWLQHLAPRCTPTASSATSQEAAGSQPPLPHHGFSVVSALLNVHIRGRFVSWQTLSLRPSFKEVIRARTWHLQLLPWGISSWGPYGLALGTGLTALPLHIKQGPWKSNSLTQGTQLVGSQAQTRSEIPSPPPGYLSTNYFFKMFALCITSEKIWHHSVFCAGWSKAGQNFIKWVWSIITPFLYRTQKYVIKYFPGNVPDSPDHHFYKPRLTVLGNFTAHNAGFELKLLWFALAQQYKSARSDWVISTSEWVIPVEGEI